MLSTDAIFEFELDQVKSVLTFAVSGVIVAFNLNEPVVVTDSLSKVTPVGDVTTFTVAVVANPKSLVKVNCVSPFLTPVINPV